jgi:hypothetical protein
MSVPRHEHDRLQTAHTSQHALNNFENDVPKSKVSSRHERICYPEGKLHNRPSWISLSDASADERNVSSTMCPVARPDPETGRNSYERYQLTNLRI